MRNSMIAWSIVATGVVVVAVLQFTVMPTSGEQRPQSSLPAYTPPKMSDGHPDLNGIWQSLTTANWDIQDHAAGPAPYPALLGTFAAIPAGQGVVEGNEIPYQPSAAARKQENFDKRMAADPNDFSIGDPEAKCYMPGVPRATYMPFPFQIVQSTNKIMMVYEFASTTRLIHMDKVDPAPAESWMGQSLGHWEGNTLVVDVTSFNDRTWFDRAGNYHSDALHVIERYTPITPYHLTYEVTIEDPKVFTRPWKMSMPLYRRMEKNAQLLEFKCVEFTEEFLYGTLRKKASN